MEMNNKRMQDWTGDKRKLISNELGASDFVLYCLT